MGTSQSFSQDAGQLEAVLVTTRSRAGVEGISEGLKRLKGMITPSPTYACECAAGNRPCCCAY